MNDLKYGKPTGGEVLKDLDYTRLNQIKHFMHMNKDESTALVKALQTDVKFLQKMRNMDYSLLLAIKRNRLAIQK